MKQIDLPNFPVWEPTYCVVNDSGGKDSTYSLELVYRALHDVCEVVAHHQLLPEAWEGTVEYCQKNCDRLGIKLIVEQAYYEGYECWLCSKTWLSASGVKRCPVCKTETGNQIAVIQGLFDLMQWRKMWPSQSVRWCTSYLKRDLFDKWARRNKAVMGERPVTVLGERWHESKNRSKLPYVRPRNSIPWLTEYRPILNCRRIEVFNGLRQFGIEPHYCYAKQGMTYHDMYETDVEGGPRCSCVTCIYLTKEELARNLAMPQHSEMVPFLVDFEDETGFTFKQDTGVREILAQYQPHIEINRLRKAS